MIEVSRLSSKFGFCSSTGFALIGSTVGSACTGLDSSTSVAVEELLEELLLELLIKGIHMSEIYNKAFNTILGTDQS